MRVYLFLWSLLNLASFYVETFENAAKHFQSRNLFWMLDKPKVLKKIVKISKKSLKAERMIKNWGLKGSPLGFMGCRKNPLEYPLSWVPVSLLVSLIPYSAIAKIILVRTLMFHILTLVNRLTLTTTIKTKKTFFFNLQDIFWFAKLWEQFLFYKNT